MTVVKTHCGLCLFGVRISKAMQMQMDAMTIMGQILFAAGGKAQPTVDGRKPKNDAMQPVGRKRADCAEQAKYEDC